MQHNRGECGEQSSLLHGAFDTAHPCQTVAMATVEREVCSIDKSATGDEGVVGLTPSAEGPWSCLGN